MWKDPKAATPSIVQTDFGPWGQLVPGDGAAYCVPTALVMGLYYLANNGFTQLTPAFQTEDDAANLELVIAGLVGTTAEGGTVDPTAGINTYLSACGMDPSQYTVTQAPANTDLQWIGTQIAPNVATGSPATIVFAVFYVDWYAPASKTEPDSLVYAGGHGLCPLKLGATAGTLVLNNPWPPSFEVVSQSASNNPQTVTIMAMPSPYTLGPPCDDASLTWYEVISGNKGSGGSFAILNGGTAWAVSSSALPASSYAPATWTIANGTMQSIDTNGGQLTVQAPIAGGGGLYKNGLGTLWLTNSCALTGEIMVYGGVLATSQATGSPFGQGQITLANGGALALSTGSPVVEAQIAGGEKQNLTIAAGGGFLQMLGASPSVVQIGGCTDGATANLARAGTGTLTLQPNLGIAGLGASQQAVVLGSGGNLPTVSNGMVAPWMLAEDIDGNQSGGFLTYDEDAGFTPAVPSLASDTGINGAGGLLYEVDIPQTITVGSVQLVALEMDGGSIAGSAATLEVGSQASGDTAGVILNGGNIAAGTLAFGAAEALFYASNAGGTVSSTVSGSGGLTLTGPGALELAADNSASLSGPIVLNSGTLVASGPNGATGPGDVTINSNATLAVTGTVSGAVTALQSGTLALDGGTVAGDVTITAGGDSSLPGGILQGGGTLNGAVMAAGNIQCGAAPGVLVFAGTLTLAGLSTFTWRLTDLVDDTNCGPGVSWNALKITQSYIFIGEGNSNGTGIMLDFSALDGDPDSGDSFWDSGHNWTLMTFRNDNWWGKWSINNPSYGAGEFSTTYTRTSTVLHLTWTPAKPKRSPAEVFAARLAARPTSKLPP